MSKPKKTPEQRREDLKKAAEKWNKKSQPEKKAARKWGKKRDN